jgi:hypothetical protein
MGAMTIKDKTKVVEIKAINPSYSSPLIAVHCCSLLFIAVHCCSLLFIAVLRRSLLFFTGHRCSLLFFTVLHCSSPLIAVLWLVQADAQLVPSTGRQ